MYCYRHLYPGATLYDNSHIHSYKGETTSVPNGGNNMHCLEGVTTYNGDHAQNYSTLTSIDFPGNGQCYMKTNKEIAILVEDEFEDVEFWYPYFRLKEAQYDATIVGSGANKEYKGKHGYVIQSDSFLFGPIKIMSMSEAKEKDWDAVIIPGGWSPDKLRQYPAILDIVRKTNERNGIIASICHGASVLVSAGILGGKKVTSYIAIKDDLINAGATWVDQEVVVNGNLITSRMPKDLPAFMKAVIHALK